MRGNGKIRWITRTAVFIALLVVMQMATAPLGNTLLTGSIVNLMLIVSVMTCGLASGLSVAAVSPVMAKLVGIGPFWGLIPFIAVGNTVLVALWHLVGNKDIGNKRLACIAAGIAAALAKFLILYMGIVQIAVPLLFRIPEPQAAVISAMFSIPQLITALTGGAAAVLVLPRLQQAVGGT